MIKRKRRSSKLRKNPTAIIAFFAILASAFILPLFGYSIFGEGFSDKNAVMGNLIIDIFSGKISFSQSYEIMIFLMAITYLAISLLYLLNGLGVIYNRYSRYASILSILFLFLGLIVVLLLNREISVPFFGNTFGAVTIGAGTYFVTIVGILYLFFVRKINSMINF